MKFIWLWKLRRQVHTDRTGRRQTDAAICNSLFAPQKKVYLGQIIGQIRAAFWTDRECVKSAGLGPAKTGFQLLTY